MTKSTLSVQNLVMSKHPRDLHTIVVIIFLCEDTIQTITIRIINFYTIGFPKND